jgi:SAM-dependent methyltransferase
MAQLAKQPVNEERLQELAEITMGYLTGQMVSLMIYLGDKLGLYESLSRMESVTADELAEATGLQERWLLEWLRNQATAGLINFDSGDRYSLSPEAATIFLNTESPFYLAGMFAAPTTPEELGHAEKGFKTGMGISWDDHGSDVACMVKRFSAPSHSMLPVFLERVNGLTERLEKGIHVVDIGCGAGVALQELAKAYPNSTFEGYDPSPLAINIAREDTRQKQLDNIEYRIARGEDLPDETRYDLVLTLDCLHDMTHPDQVTKAIRKSIKPDGIWVIKDIHCSDKMEENFENPMSPLFYGISVLYCMSSALSEPDGAGLGTMGFNPKLAQEMTSEGGFNGFEEIEIEEDPFNNFYAVYP